jgi:hypothetical protein
MASTECATTARPNGFGNRHVFTKEERQRGFRNAVLSIQERHGLGFNEAVQFMKRKFAKEAGFGGNWVAHEQARQARLAGL